MEKLLMVVSQATAREFQGTSNGQPSTVKVVDVTLSDGINQFLVSAFDKQAQRLIDEPLKAGGMINADLQFSIRKSKNEKGVETSWQHVRLANYGIIVNP